MEKAELVVVAVEGYFTKTRRAHGPLGQTAARYPWRAVPNRTLREVTLTKEERARLVRCTLCGRMTAYPHFHKGQTGFAQAHCEICDKFRDEEGRIDGWYGGPYAVIQ